MILLDEIDIETIKLQTRMAMDSLDDLRRETSKQEPHAGEFKRLAEYVQARMDSVIEHCTTI